MIPAVTKLTIFDGPQIDPIQSGPVIVWKSDIGALSILKYDDGTALILSRRDDQPTRAYELSADDISTLARFLVEAM